MVKKSKSSVKGVSKASGEEETLASETEVYIPTPKGGIIDFYYLCCGLGILLMIIMIIFIPLHYVYHTL
jgi:hypothetical protein